MTTLYDPLSIGELRLKNRIILAPLTRSRAGKERMANELMATYYEQRAGAGLLITEATVISEQGIGWNESPGIYTKEQGEAWKVVVDRVHAKETPLFLQLWHCGRASHSSFREDRSLPVSASAIKLNEEYIHTPEGKQSYETPRPLDTEEVSAVVEDYRVAAQRAKEAGFDGVEVHAANGYLLDQFLQSKTNQREDRYGGSLENRFRFLKEVLEAVTTVFPSERVGVRLAPNGAFNDMGSPDFRETFLYVAEQLNTFNLGYVHIMDGLAFGFHELGEAMTLAEFRTVYKGLLMGNCGYDKETAEAAVAKGDADMIAIGRPYISNPDLAERYKNNWPLNDDAEIDTWYSTDYKEKGYTDFPFYQKA